ncbi:zincin-like metallopeptidase domain-containing protein [Pseudoalteromonas galatheae]|uniref:zincin-like metallopeptidase domain-containing protein n=1 Tax=Pseudoalteromonas galatheae TaxID=579562 RepID=UPI0030CF2977
MQKGLSVPQVQKLFDDFIADFNGNFDVLPFIKEKQEQIYGEANSKEKSGVTIEGAYHPASRFITLITSNLDNEEAAKRTIRHELLGHYGLNTFKPDEKMDLLTSVLETQEEKSLKHIWDNVNNFYGSKSPLERAEEVFAFVAEEERSFISSAWDSVRATFQKTLRKCGLSKRSLTMSELRTEAKAIAKGIKSGQRELQTFPSNDQAQFRKDSDMKQRKPFHEVVAENLIKQLEQGTAPWQKPWKEGHGMMPYNPISDKRYKGINTVHLMAQGYEDPRWLTYKQAKSLGAQVRQGEKSTSIQYWKFTEERIKKDSKGKTLLDPKTQEPIKEFVKLERPKVFYANVFNAEQIDNMPERAVKQYTWDGNERAEQILKRSGARIRLDQADKAFYRPSTDTIHLPPKEQFENAGNYYATALHELGHWTGHPSRLNRDLSNPFGSEGYAKEELVAEISSMIMGEELNIGHDTEQHAAYVGSWIKALKDDPFEIFRAAANAEKTVSFVLGLENKQIQKDVEEQLKEKSEQAFETYEAIQRAADSLGYSVILQQDNEDFKLNYHRRNIDANFSSVLDDNGLIITTQDGEPERTTSVEYVKELLLAEAKKYWDKQRELSPQILPKYEKRSITTHDGQILCENLNRDQAHKVINTIIKLSNEMIDVENGFYTKEDWNEEAAKFGLPPIDVEKWTGEVAVKEDDGLYKVTAKQHDAISTVYSTHSMKEEANYYASILAAIKKQSDIYKGIPTMKSEEHKQQDFQRVSTERLSSTPNKVFLNVPFKEKQEAKELGAKWDRERRSWYIRETMDKGPFEKWLKPEGLVSQLANSQTNKPKGLVSQLANSQTNKPEGLVSQLANSQTNNERIYLAVPFKEKEIAKKAGAKWDSVNASWYADNKSDISKLKQYLPENVPNQQSPRMTPEQEFAKALTDTIGAVISDDHPMMDGEGHRIEVDGDKKGEKSGFYIGHLDGRPAGYMMNNRTGVEVKWKSNAETLTDEEKSVLKAESAKKKQERLEAKNKLYEANSDLLTDFYVMCPVTNGNETYLSKKGVDGVGLKVVPSASDLPEDYPIKVAADYKEFKQLREDNPDKHVFVTGELLLPAHDKNNRLWSLQAIQPHGQKRFATDAKKSGNFFVIGGMEELDRAPVIIISEGYATGKDVSSAAKLPTVVAFDSGNLLTVAKVMRDRYPDKPILIGGDDDRKNETVHPFKNVGKEKAKEAAEAVNGKAFFPVFAPHEAESGLTDFNDLKMKSSLGKSGLERQIQGVVGSVLQQEAQKKKDREHSLDAEKVSKEQGYKRSVGR